MAFSHDSSNNANKVAEPPVNVENTLDGAKVRAILDNSVASTAVGDHIRLLEEIPSGMRILSLSGSADWGIYSEASDGTLTARAIGDELPKGEKLALQNDGAGAIAAEDVVLTYVADNS